MFQLELTESGTSESRPGDWEFQILGLQQIPRIIALTGATKSGKTLIAKRLATEYGFHYVNLGSILAKIASAMGEPDLRWEHLSKIGRILREFRGKDVLARLAFRILRSQAVLPERIILDSLLHPKEIEFFQKRCDLTLIGIETDTEVRVRQFARWSDNNPEECKQAIAARDRLEQYRYNNHDPFAPSVDECLSLIGNPKWLIHIKNEIAAHTVIDPVDQIMEELSHEWSLKRQTAPISTNNYPYWNQKTAPPP